MKNYILENINSNAEILSFISKFQIKRNIEINFNYDKLDSYHGLEFYKSKVTEIMDIPETPQEIKEFCEIFLGKLEDKKI